MNIFENSKYKYWNTPSEAEYEPFKNCCGNRPTDFKYI